MITVTICVGSSCHIKGAREISAHFNGYLNKESLRDKTDYHSKDLFDNKTIG